jgi:hypothetical protein
MGYDKVTAGSLKAGIVEACYDFISLAPTPFFRAIQAAVFKFHSSYF